ncbi:MAG: mechanosensitive ion channel [Elusimicrobia bacterium]|nr:mechanosensitive ion channel [Elusimicrobiota bacterium]
MPLISRILSALLLLPCLSGAACAEKTPGSGVQELSGLLETAIVSTAACPGGCRDEGDYLQAQELGALYAKRLNQALSDPAIFPADISYSVDGDIVSLQAGPVALAQFHYARLSPDRDSALKRAAALAAELKASFRAVKERNFSISVLMKFLLAFIYPLAFIGILLALRAAYRRARLFMHALEDTRPQGIRLGRFELVSLPGLRVAVNAVLGGAVLLSAIAAVYFFLIATFYYFPVTRSYALSMFALLGMAGRTFGGYVFSAGWHIAAVIAIVMAVYSVTGWLDKLFDRLADAGPRPLPFLSAERLDIFEYMAKGLAAFLGFVAMLLLLPGRGGLLGSVPLLLLGLVFALAASGPFRNIVAGFLLAFSKSHTRGAAISLSGRTGVLLRIGVFFSTIRFSDGSVRMVPNSGILSGQVHMDRAYEAAVWDGEVVLGSDPVALSELHSLLEKWAESFGSGSHVKITGLRGRRVSFRLTMPFIQSSDPVFLPAVCDGLAALLSERKLRLSRFELHP